MTLIIHGTKKVPIGEDEFFVKCPSCEVHSWSDVTIFSNYYHVCWIPIFPFEKEASVTCSNCRLKSTGVRVNSNLISDYNEIKRYLLHPWFTYTGITIFSAFAIVAILSKIA